MKMEYLAWWNWWDRLVCAFYCWRSWQYHFHRHKQHTCHLSPTCNNTLWFQDHQLRNFPTHQFWDLIESLLWVSISRLLAFPPYLHVEFMVLLAFGDPVFYFKFFLISLYIIIFITLSWNTLQSINQLSYIE